MKRRVTMKTIWTKGILKKDIKKEEENCVCICRYACDRVKWDELMEIFKGNKNELEK